MDSTSRIASSSFLMIKSTSISSLPILKQIHFHPSKKSMIIKASSNNSSTPPNPFISTIKTTTAAVVFTLAVFGKFHCFPARAILRPTITQENSVSEVRISSNTGTTLNPEAIRALKTSLQKKLKAGKNKECLKILQKLSSAEPKNRNWKYLAARLLTEKGNTQEACEVLISVLVDGEFPSIETMFEILLLVDLSCLDEHAKLLEEKVNEVFEGVGLMKEERKVRFFRLCRAQLIFLLKNMEEALRSYEELEKEDPNDCRPYFCKGMIYTLLDRKKEAKEQFAKYCKLSPKKIEVEWYLRTPTPRMRLFLTPGERIELMVGDLEFWKKLLCF